MHRPSKITRREFLLGAVSGAAATAAVVAGGSMLAGFAGPGSPVDKAEAVEEAEPWWHQDVVVSYSHFQVRGQRHWLDFVRDLGTTVCDRGVHYYYGEPTKSKADVVEYYHQHGLQVTSFQSLGSKWKPDEAGVQTIIAQMGRPLNDGCDGVHLDMLFDVDDPAANVLKSDTAIRAVQRMRDAVHGFPGAEQPIFSGNAWSMDTPFCLAVAKLSDVAWTETYGHDDMDLVRVARIGRSLDDYAKPVWNHWQPADNEQDRISKLGNLPKALWSSCLMEGAVFLCNYRYPVRVPRTDSAGQTQMHWTVLYINDRWKASVLQYARFVRENARLMHHAQPAAPVLVAFTPQQIGQANPSMNALLMANIPFNVHVYGKWPFEDLGRCPGLDRYECVVTPDVETARKVGCRNVAQTAKELLAALPAGVADFCRAEGQTNVLTRTFVQGRKRLIHIKQLGYTDNADALPRMGPLTLTMRCPDRIQSAACLSPDFADPLPVAFSQQGNQLRVTVPRLEYYNLLVLEA